MTKLTHVYIQARIGSKRLPKKILKKICGKSILSLIHDRLTNIKDVNKIHLVTGDLINNSELIEEARRLKIEYFSGNEENILDRFNSAANKFSSDIIIRVNGDCPLIDFNVIEKGLEIFNKNNYDILSITRKRTYPHGFDFEIFSKSALTRSWKINLANFTNEEEFKKSPINPTKYMLENDQDFSNYDLINHVNLSHIRLTLDYDEDFELIQKIYEHLYSQNNKFSLPEIMDYLNNNPSLLEINKKHAIYSNI
jgi:spore coat polysaccharide biosynthesis protein SpsF